MSNVDPFAPFRPRRGRATAIGFAVASIVVFGGIALAMRLGGYSNWSLLDALVLLGFGVLLAAGLWRFAALRATPSPAGLVVRNVVLTRRVAWSDVAAVRFGGGEAWLWLDLVDGDELAVMAVQRADGAFGRAQAERLAALVQTQGGTARRPRPPA